jgi:hypothetical protein
VRTLQSQTARFTRLLVETAPNDIVDGLIAAVSERRLRALPGLPSVSVRWPAGDCPMDQIERR